MSVLAKSLISFVGIAGVFGAMAFTQHDDERVKAEDAAEFGPNVVATACDNVTYDSAEYHAMHCEPR